MSNYRSEIEEIKARFLDGLGIPDLERFEVDPFQQEAINSVLSSVDTLVVAPTGSGKTYIALEAIRATLKAKKRAVYTTPLKALSNTKFTELKRIFEPEFKVGILTGDRKIDTDADIVVATTEIYRNELYGARESNSLVVLDEVHYIADGQRGPVWEESIILTPGDTTMLMLSASISNSTEIAEWVSSTRGKPCHVVIRKDRPVELRFGFLHPEYGALPLSDKNGKINKEVIRFYGSSHLNSAGTRLSFSGADRKRGGREFRRGSRRSRR